MKKSETNKLACWWKPSFPKAIGLASAAGLVAMFQFKHVEPKPSQIKTASTSMIHKKVKEAPQSFAKTPLLPKPPSKSVPSKSVLTLNLPQQKEVATAPVKKQERPRRKSRKVKHTTVVQPKQAAFVFPAALEKEFELSHTNRVSEVNLPSPLESLVQTGFEEAPLTEGVHSNPLVSSLALDPAMVLDIEYPQEIKYREVVSEVQEREFETEKKTLAGARGALKELAHPPAPVSEIVPATPSTNPQQQVAKNAQEKGAMGLANPAVGDDSLDADKKADKKNVLIAAATSPAVFAQPSTTDSGEVHERNAGTLSATTPPQAIARNQLMRNPKEAPSHLDVEKNVLVAAAASAPVGTQVPWVANRPQLAGPAGMTSLNRQTTHGKANQKRRSIVDGAESTELIEGRVTVDAKVQDWLSENEGNMVLYFQTMGKERRNTLRIGKVEHEDYFKEPANPQEPLRLYIKFFKKTSTRLQAKVEYPTLIRNENVREMIQFHIEEEVFRKALKRQAYHPRRGLVATLPIFEFSFDKPWEPTPVVGAEVRIDGFPNLGPFISDEGGNARIRGVPTRSNFRVRVTAEGYLPSTDIIASHTEHVHQPIYLLPHKKAGEGGAIEYFTRQKQLPSAGLLYLRSYDPLTPDRLVNENYGLAYSEETHPVYFEALNPGRLDGLGLFGAWMAKFIGAIPNPRLEATTELGLAMVPNVAPPFQAVLRDGKRPWFFYVPPEQVQVKEFGRGVGSFIGKVEHPFDEEAPEARVRLLGDRFVQTTTGKESFRVSNIDFSGLLTVSVKVGDTIGWHNFGFNPQISEEKHALYFLDHEDIEESRYLNRVRKERQRATILGWLHGYFFKSEKQCVYVELVNAEGEKVSWENGPYPITRVRPKQDELCLTEDNPDFIYFNLPRGEYIQKVLDERGKLLRTRLLHVGTRDRQYTFAVN